MSAAAAAGLGAAAGALVAIAVTLLVRRRRRARRLGAPGAARIAFPFVGHSLSAPALEAALRLAAAQRATLVPVFLAVVPLRLPLESALPRQSSQALDLLEAVEQQAARAGVPVDARIERGRTARHALVEALGHERFDRIVVPAQTSPGEGFAAEDVAWLLEHVAEEVVVLRPAAASPPVPPAPAARPPLPPSPRAAALPAPRGR